jgi:uncharacterized protein (TIRG00374 family)
MIDSVENLRGKGLLVKTALSSLTIWSLGFLIGWFLLRSVGIDFSLAKAIVVYTVPVLASSSPLQLLGGFGSYEGPLVAVLLVLGIPKEQAIASSLILHIQELGFLSILAAVGFSWYLRQRRFRGNV